MGAGAQGKAGNSMLRVVYVAATRRTAELLQSALQTAGLLASLRQAVTELEGPCEILVPVSEVDDAIEVINQNLCRLGKVSRKCE